MAEGRGSEALIARLTEQDGITRDFAAGLLEVLADARPLEVTRRDGGVQVTFSGEPDDDWCGNTTARMLKLKRKFGVHIDVDWFPFGLIELDLLLGRIRVTENLAMER